MEQHTEEQNTERLNHTIAANLRRVRRERGLSLDELAELTGVSKSMLGSLERGACGASVATLWKIAGGLRLSFTALMQEENAGVAVIDMHTLEPLTDGTDRFRLYPVFPFDAGRSFEILSIELAPGGRSDSAPHRPGTEEYTLVYAGTLTLELDEAGYSVPAGHAIRYPADRPHAYANTGDVPVQLCMVIHYA